MGTHVHAPRYSPMAVDSAAHDPQQHLATTHHSPAMPRNSTRESNDI